MKRLSSQRAIDAWERGQGADRHELPLALLSVALPDEDRERLARLSVGQRDALLMRLREKTFGRGISGYARCPQCATRLQFDLDLAAYDVDGTLERRIEPEVLEVDGWQIRFRVPDGTDLALASRLPDEETARRVLLQRCVLGVRHQGEPASAGELPEPVVEVLGARMEELDPLAYLSLAIDCARCGHNWLVLFDIGSLFWEEISQSAERLLHEVQTLALVYGWSESEILSMSQARRRFYLEKAPSDAAAGPAQRRA